MTTRVLPVEEWPRLPEGQTVWPLLDPSRASIIAVEEDGEIVGTITLMSVVHAECLWIAPSHRRSVGVARRLLRALWTQGRAGVWASSISDEMDQFIERVGGKRLPGASFVIPFEVPPCRQ